MDTIPDAEFLGMFHRLNMYVRLGRATTGKEIRKRIRNILKLQRKASQKARRASTVKKYRSEFMRLRNLYKHHIEQRIIREAEENPGSIYDLTLKLGYNRARRTLQRNATPKRMRRVR